MKQWRICVLGDWDRYMSHFLYGCLEGAIRNGAWARPVPLFGHDLGQIEKQIIEFKPHVVLCHMIFNQKPHNRDHVFGMLKRVRYKGSRVVYHLGDARKESRYPHDISDIVDMALLNSGLTREYSETWKVPVYHWPYMCLYQKHIAEPCDEFRHAVVFTGMLASDRHHGPRTEFISQLSKRIDIKCYPTGESGNTRFQTAEVAASAKAVLGYQMGLDVSLYTDVRPFQYIGAGALYFHDKCEAMDRFFIDGEHYISFERGSVDSFLDKFQYYMDRPKKQSYIRHYGFYFCQNFHSTKERIRFVMDVLEGKATEPMIYLDSTGRMTTKR